MTDFDRGPGLPIGNNFPRPAISLRDIAVTYDGGATFAAKDVSFEVAAGAFVSLVGSSGSGKTSILKTINRLVEPSRGAVEIDGRSALDEPAYDLRRRIGYAFQGVGLFPHMSVGENIAVTPALLGWPPARVAERIGALLDLVELPRDFATRRPSDLSGGQQQRVGLARALAAEPKIMLLDEAFGALDPVTRVSLGDAYRAIHERVGATTILVTHDMQEALALSDRILVMHAGRLAADATPRALMNGEAPEEAARLLEAPKRRAARLAALTQRPNEPS